MTVNPFTAKCASDRNPDWPYWYVEGPDGVNQTARLLTWLMNKPVTGYVLPKKMAELLSAYAVEFNYPAPCDPEVLKKFHATLAENKEAA
ncbi:hypothetical protein SAMN05216358_0057 [Rhizobium sp. AN5]|uniref:hypothetical protein n=1 Tax=Rhizobium sp. AN5 TaxID=1855304 RepID=UPI000BD7FE22|nr:hypothetical protein [Rhizobium sp. AN5]SOC90038.1 hypothetical protein SAMN05216358_0057 [Rhizobium sp. AN5]